MPKVFSRLETRLIAWYTVMSVGVLFVVVAVCTAFAFTMFAHGTNETIGFVANQAHDLEPRYAQQHLTMRQVAPRILARLQRPGLRLVIIGPYGPERGPGVVGYHYVVHAATANETRNRSSVARAGEAPPNGPPPGPPPPAWRNFSPDGSRRDNATERFVLSLGGLIGLHPQRVPFLDGTIVVAPDADRLESTFATYFAVIVPLGILAAIIAWFTGRIITSTVLRPLYEVTDALEAFSGGDFTPRAIPAARQSDFGALAHAYNGAAQQVAQAFAEREAAETHMRQFVADASHELRTPLTVVMGFIDVLRRRISSQTDPSQKIFETIAIESQRMRVLIDNLILLAKLDRPPETRAYPVDVAAVAQHVVETRRAIATRNTLAYAGSETAWIVADENEIHEAIGNLVDNAVKYAPGARIEVGVETSDQHIRIRVADNGPGMTQEEAAHAFDRFYRGDARGEVEGSGLGLAIVKRAVERAHGTIVLTSRPGSGTEFAIALPREADVVPLSEISNRSLVGSD